MQLPAIRNPAKSHAVQKTFGGYDHTASCAETAFFEECNLSARSYPALSPRAPRVRLAQTLAVPHGLFALNGLLWVDGTQLYYNGAQAGIVSDSDKTFCAIGARVLIWPDKLLFDTETGTLSPLGAKWAAVGNVGFAPAKENGAEYSLSATGPTPPEASQNGDYWLDTGGETDVLRVYSAAGESWGAVPATYIRVSAAGIGKAFRQYDTVTLSGVAESALGSAAESLNADLTVWDRGDDFITVTGLLDESALQSPAQGEIVLERRVPELAFLTQSDNRVWGATADGHEIYACRLGDPFNWYSYLGTAADSYAATVGSEGKFTGAATAQGYVLFFKAGLVHKVYGTKPANYQVTTVACPGIAAGAAASAAVAEATLYYLSPEGVMAYDGSLPTKVGKALGDTALTAKSAGALGGEYYLAVQEGPQRPGPANEDAEPGEAERRETLLCYSAEKGIWHRQDSPAIRWMAAAGGVLYFLTAKGALWAICSAGGAQAALSGEEEADVEWSAQTGPIGLLTADRKFVSRLEVRAGAAAGAFFRIEARYDGGAWKTLATLCPKKKQALAVPIVPCRFDRMELRFSGRGECIVYTLCKTLEQGSEL